MRSTTRNLCEKKKHGRWRKSTTIGKQSCCFERRRMHAPNDTKRRHTSVVSDCVDLKKRCPSSDETLSTRMLPGHFDSIVGVGAFGSPLFCNAISSSVRPKNKTTSSSSFGRFEFGSNTFIIISEHNDICSKHCDLRIRCDSDCLVSLHFAEQWKLCRHRVADWVHIDGDRLRIVVSRIVCSEVARVCLCDLWFAIHCGLDLWKKASLARRQTLGVVA